MVNLLTFDVEEWFHANYGRIDRIPLAREDNRIGRNVGKLLSLCDKYSAKATFFILAATAEKHPDIISMIEEKGHEVASHGYRHSLVYNMSPAEFEDDLQKSITILQGLTAESIIGYRAPSWSAYEGLHWFFEILEKHGIVYDSSLFPAKTYLYGDAEALRFPHRIGNIVEIPASTLNLMGMRIPFAGGFYLRLFPSLFITAGIKILNKKNQPAVVYVHPREIDRESPRLQLPLKERFIHYVNLKTTEKKLDRLLRDFRFCSIREYVKHAASAKDFPFY